MFQSAPRSEERGDMSVVRLAQHRYVFQSAPRSEERGDLLPQVLLPRPSGFNPRPAPRSGAIRHGLMRTNADKRFNPRPAPRSGAIGVFRKMPQRSPVSIRAPLRGAGRYSQRRDFAARSMFQSAPRSEERGDGFISLSRAKKRSFNPRPAPRSGAMGPQYRELLRKSVSIRAPLRGAGRFDDSGTVTATMRFNPRPAPRSGAIPLKSSKGVSTSVSIRAPLRGAGRWRRVSRT